MPTTLRKREKVAKSLRVDAADVADAVVVAVVALIVSVPDSVSQQMNLFVVVRRMTRTNVMLQGMIGRLALTMKSRLLQFRGNAVIEVDWIHGVTATIEVLAETGRIVASVLNGVTVREIVANVVRTVTIGVVVANALNVVIGQLVGNALTAPSARTSLIGQCGVRDLIVEAVASGQSAASVVVLTVARSVVVLSVIGVIATGIWNVMNDLSVAAT